MSDAARVSASAAEWTYHTDSDLEDLRVAAARLAALSLVFIAAVLLLAVAAAVEVFQREAWMLALGLAIVGTCAYRLSVHRLRLSVTLLGSGLSLTLVGAIHLYPTTPIVCALSIVVVYAGALLGWRSALGAAVGVSGLVIGLASAPAQPISGETAAIALLLTWANVFASWLLLLPLRTTLDWSWHSYAQALRTTEEARARQGELGQLSKSLGESYYRLERLAAELDVARHAAEEARLLKSRFAAAISHELRTPLNLIIGFSEMMARSPRSSYDEPLPDSYAEDIEAIYRNAGHISTLIDDILDLSQIDANRMALQKQPTELVKIIDEAISSLSARFNAMGLRLAVDVPSDLPVVLVDPTRVRQILLNLLVNAMRFTTIGGVIVRAAVDPDGREVIVSVADTGAGIAAEDLPHVFEEFRQSGQPEQRRGGVGLGLMVSKQFVEMHGGNMWVESILGKGSTFYFSVPISGDVVISSYSSPPRVSSLPSNGEEPAVVVLDESIEVARIFQRYLDGYVALHATSVTEAVQIAMERPIRAMIIGSDELPLDWARQQTNEHLRRLPVITCSLLTSRTTARELGVVEYLTKPITRERLAAVLDHLIDPATYPSSASRQAPVVSRQPMSRLAKDDFDSLRVRAPWNWPHDVIVADDDPEMARLLARMIQSILGSCRIRSAGDGGQCLDLLSREPPDVLFLDLLMPKLDGYTVLERMRGDDRLQGVPVVVITAKSNHDEMIISRKISITRPGGLSVGETVKCLESSLDAFAVRP